MKLYWGDEPVEIPFWMVMGVVCATIATLILHG